MNPFARNPDSALRALVDSSQLEIKRLSHELQKLDARLGDIEVTLKRVDERLSNCDSDGQADMKFAMLDARLTHVERVAGIEESGGEAKEQLANLLDNRLRAMEMRLMNYLEGPYQARISQLHRKKG